jgi:hypothetical protein
MYVPPAVTYIGYVFLLSPYTYMCSVQIFFKQCQLVFLVVGRRVYFLVQTVFLFPI